MRAWRGREIFQAFARKIWSGRRGSNPRPRPWQGRALPTELLPQILASNYLLYRQVARPIINNCALQSTILPSCERIILTEDNCF